MLDKRRDARGAMAGLGLTYYVDWAQRIVKRRKNGMPVNPQELAKAEALLAHIKAHSQ